jgi:hypothetical protein
MQGFKEKRTPTKIYFTVTFMDGKEKLYLGAGFAKMMKLERKIPTTNMWLLDRDEKLKKYVNVLDIIQVIQRLIMGRVPALIECISSL